MLNKVRAGQGISARGWNQIIDAVVDLQNSASLWQGGGSGITCSIKNNTGNKAKAGAVLEVTGIRNSNKSPTDLRDIWLNSGFQLEGNTPSSTSTVLAYLIDGCGAGKTAECVVPGIFASYVSYPSGTASKTRASLTTKFTAGATGNYRIIGRSNIATIDGENQAFCYLTYSPQTGHRVATLEEDLEGDGTTTVSPTPPMFRSGPVDATRSAHFMRKREMPTIFELLNTTQRGGFGPTIEVLSNAVCPRNCPACNQRSFMTAYPDYEYTPDDALEFLKALNDNGITVGVVFSGGEPSRWSFIWEVLSLFGSSQNVTSIRVTTSDDDPNYITRLKTFTDKIYFSHRPDHKWSRSNPPEYMRGVNIWSAEEHVIWPTQRWEGATVCCCRNVGIIGAVVGRGVYPCIVALNMKERGKWDDLEPVSLEDYFSGKVSLPPIGTYEACRWCVNNDIYRDSKPPTHSTEKRGK